MPPKESIGEFRKKRKKEFNTFYWHDSFSNAKVSHIYLTPKISHTELNQSNISSRTKEQIIFCKTEDTYCARA